MTAIAVSLAQASSNVRLDLRLDPRRRWVVWWHGATQRGIRDNTQPKVAVLFRALDANDELTENYAHRDMNVTDLGLLLLGSVWSKGRLVSDVKRDHHKFHVRFSAGGWRFMNASATIGEALQYVIPPFAYPFLKRNALPQLFRDTQLLRFDSDQGLDLCIPCMAFFSHLYGSSEELRRVLLTYPWPDVEQRLFREIPPDWPQAPDGHWTVCRASRISDGDVPFLARVKYREGSRKAAQSLYAQMEAVSPDRPVFLQVPPWWDDGEPVTIEVSGIEIPPTGIYLATRIHGISAPPLKPILSLRPDAMPPAGAEGSDTADAGGSTPLWNRHSTPCDMLKVSEDYPPDQEAPTRSVVERPLLWLSEPPDVTVVRNASEMRTRCRGILVGERGEPLPDEFSAGERQGNDKGVGVASIYTPFTLESHGTLRDMWRGMQRLVDTEYSAFGHLAYFTFAEGIVSGDEPKLIPFCLPVLAKEAGSDDSSSTKRNKARVWIDIHDEADAPPRGLLVARMPTDKGPVYFAEIERRMRQVRDSEGALVDDEWEEREQFCGLVFTLEDEAKLPDWITTVMNDLPKSNGVFRALLLGDCPGEAMWFKHVHPRTNTDPFTHIIRRAIALVTEKL